MSTRERLRSVRDQCVSLLAHAQTIRIQQVQATSEWEQRYRNNADEAWASMNRLSESIEAELGKLIAEQV